MNVPRARGQAASHHTDDGVYLTIFAISKTVQVAGMKIIMRVQPRCHQHQPAAGNQFMFSSNYLAGSAHARHQALCTTCNMVLHAKYE